MSGNQESKSPKPSFDTLFATAQQSLLTAVFHRGEPDRAGVRQHDGAPARLCRPVFPVQPRRELVAGRGHRQIRQLQHRPGRRRARGERRKNRLRLFRRHQHERAGKRGAGHARDRQAGRRRRPCRCCITARGARSICRTTRSPASRTPTRSRCWNASKAMRARSIRAWCR